MAIVNGYATLAEVKAAARITDSVDDALLELAIESSSRMIDGYCERVFYTTGSAVTRYYSAESNLVCTIDDVAGSGSTAFDFLSLVGFSRVMGVALVLAAVEIVLVSALSTLFAFLYNLSVGLTGGLEVTLSEDS